MKDYDYLSLVLEILGITSMFADWIVSVTIMKYWNLCFNGIMEKIHQIHKLS